MNKIISFFKLVRWPNLLMTAIMMLLVYYRLMLPLFATGMPGVVPDAPAFVLLLISIIFIVAGGYVINDIFDVEVDNINKPEKVLVTKVFSDKESKVFYRILTFLGLACGLSSSILISGSKFYTLFLILILLAGILYSYSATYKKKLIVGNLIVSISVALSVFLPWLFEMLYLLSNALILYAVKDAMLSVLPFVLVYAFFAFMMTLFREIVKDAEDFQGDLVTRCRTIPIVLGIKKMNVILVVLSALTCIFLAYFIVVLYRIQSYISLGFIFVVWNGVLFSMFLLLYKNAVISYHRYSVFLKIMMLIGVLSMLFI